MGLVYPVLPHRRAAVICTAVAGLALLSGCEFLEAPATGYSPSAKAESAAYPLLLTQNRIADVEACPVEMVDEVTIRGRADALQQKAQALSAPVLDPETRARLQAASATN